MLSQVGWVSAEPGCLAPTSGWTELDDDEVNELGPRSTPQALERSRGGARAAMLFYCRDPPPSPAEQAEGGEGEGDDGSSASSRDD